MIFVKSYPSILSCMMLSFQGQVMESIFIDSICGLAVLDEWFYLSNQSINCVNLGTSLNLVHSNLGGSKQSRMLRAINQEDALCICNDHILILFDFISNYGMVCTSWLALKVYPCLEGLWWVVSRHARRTIAVDPLVHMILGYWALLLMTNVLIFMQYEYLSAEEACQWCFSEWEGMYYVKCWPWCGVNKINWLGKVNCYPMCCILVSDA